MRTLPWLMRVMLFAVGLSLGMWRGKPTTTVPVTIEVHVATNPDSRYPSTRCLSQTQLRTVALDHW
jgi:hypothetical protein